MTDPDHGNSIITRLRLIVERMHVTHPDMSDHDAMRAEAENLLPIASADDIEVIVLREAAAILNGRGFSDLSERVEHVGDSIAEDYEGR